MGYIVYYSILGLNRGYIGILEKNMETILVRLVRSVLHEGHWA